MTSPLFEKDAMIRRCVGWLSPRDHIPFTIFLERKRLMKSLTLPIRKLLLLITLLLSLAACQGRDEGETPSTAIEAPAATTIASPTVLPSPTSAPESNTTPASGAE